MNRAPDRSAAVLLRGFQKVCALLERENDLLKTGKLQDVVNMLPAKQKEMEALEGVLAGQDAAPASPDRTSALLTPETEAAARHFGALVRTNRRLLRNAIDAQNYVLRLIVVEAAQMASAGYGSSGQYATNTIPQGALTLRSDV